GPPAAEARDLLLRYTQQGLRETWPDRGPVIVEGQVAGSLLDRAQAAVLALPPDPLHEGLAQQAAASMRNVVRQRWTLIGESESSVSPILVGALTVWMGLIFANCGYNAPRNTMVVVVLLVCAAAIAAAIALVVEMDGAFTGLIVVSDEPVRRALEYMQQ
ncbi:MAG: hypothetical protein JO326_13360, partial [Acetobacteraceae bacterium]|nr:hypothetical protein [Acetobacteraceae bacterium]